MCSKRIEMKHLSLHAQADAIALRPPRPIVLQRPHWVGATISSRPCLLSAELPIDCGPSYGWRMWTHPSVREHVGTLCARGTIVVNPELARSLPGRSAKGAWHRKAQFLEAIQAARTTARLARARMLLSAVRHKSRSDPVRFISNRSSGNGYAIAEARPQGSPGGPRHWPTALPVPKDSRSFR